jgi:hypothetical protein
MTSRAEAADKLKTPRMLKPHSALECVIVLRSTARGRFTINSAE